jgi:poly(A) polymerase
VDRLADAGHTAYLAGGCVRDELLGLRPKDYDVATDAPPDRVLDLFDRTREVGRSFGVVLVRVGGVEVEVATFRREGPYSDKRRPDHVEFCTAEEDAHRRDFTINALFIDPRDAGERAGGRVIDHVGGVADLEARIIRAVGDPEDRLAEDHLRALRAARFAARLGFSIEPGTAGAIRRHARDLAGVSRERIGEELRRMLAHASRAGGTARLHDLGLDGPVLEEPPMGEIPTPRLEALRDEAPATAGLAAWALDRAAAGGSALDWDAVVRDLPETVRRWRRALCLSNDEADRLRWTLADAASIAGSWREMRESARMRLAAKPAFGVSLRLVGVSAPGLAAAVREEVGSLAARPGGLSPTPLITGDDLIALGLPPGPDFARWLAAVYDAQLEGEVGSREAALALARRLAGG